MCDKIKARNLGMIKFLEPKLAIYDDDEKGRRLKDKLNIIREAENGILLDNRSLKNVHYTRNEQSEVIDFIRNDFAVAVFHDCLDNAIENFHFEK